MKTHRKALAKLLAAVVVGAAVIVPFAALADSYGFEYPVISYDTDGPGTIVTWKLVRYVTDGTGGVPYKQIQFGIWRDGELIDTVTGTDSYRDLGAVAGEVHKYQVSALGAWSPVLSLLCYGSYHFWAENEAFHFGSNGTNCVDRAHLTKKLWTNFYSGETYSWFGKYHLAESYKNFSVESDADWLKFPFEENGKVEYRDRVAYASSDTSRISFRVEPNMTSAERTATITIRPNTNGDTWLVLTKITIVQDAGPADAPYDFYPCVQTDRISGVNYPWSMLVTTNRYVYGKTKPVIPAEIYDDETLYLSYNFDEYWRTAAFNVTNVFTLTGTKKGSFGRGASVGVCKDDVHWWTTNAVPELLQGLPVGDYALTVKLNGDNRLGETDYSNNSTSIAFKVVAAPLWTVTFNPNGGEVSEPTRQVKRNTAIGSLPVPARRGYDFLGWFTKSSGGTQVDEASRIVAPSATVYAHWAKATTFTLVLSKNDGTGTTFEQKVTYGVSTNLPGAAATLKWAPRRGFRFMGWAEGEKSKTVYLADKAELSKNLSAGETKTVYAIWQLDTANAYAIQYIRNDGSGSVRTVGFIGGVDTRLNSVAALGFARRGYTFGGWALSTDDARAKKAWKPDMGNVSQPVPNGKLLQVYAIWTLADGYYSIRFNKNDGTGKWRELGYEYGKNTTLPTVANGLGWTREGYEFVGWGTSASATTAWRGDAGTTKTPVAEGKTLSIYAIWKKTAANVVLPPPVRAQAAAALRASEVAAFEPIIRTGELADGSGEYALSLDFLDADGVMSGHFVVGTEAATAAYACDAVWLGDDLLVETEDGDLAVVSPDGTATLL